MIPFPNVIAGILIGIANDEWLMRIVIPFIWGFIFCFTASITWHDRKSDYIEQAKMLNRPLKFGMSPLLAFYFIEYFTASSTALVFSVIAGFVMLWIK